MTRAAARRPAPEGLAMDGDPLPIDTAPFGWEAREEVLAWARSAWPWLLYVIAAVVVLWSSLLHPTSVHLARNEGDEYFFEWMLTSTADAVKGLHNPLYATSMNAPDGVNLMANNGLLLLGVPLTPVTLLLGAPLTLGLILVGNLVATCAAWRWFFGRHLPIAGLEGRGGGRSADPDRGPAAGVSPVLGWVAGLVCGFGPGMVSHSIGHPNLSAQWLAPVIVDRVLRLVSGRATLGRGGAWRRDGVILGFLTAAQAFLSEEVLLLTAMTLLLLIVCHALQRPASVRGAPALLGGLGIGAVVATAILAYPLWFQFYGPQSYSAIADSPITHAANIQSYLAFPAQSIAGNAAVAAHLGVTSTEQGALLGRPLLILFALAAAFRIRDAAARTATVCALILAALSFGPVLRFGHAKPAFHGLWYYIQSFGPMRDALPVRAALPVLPLVVFVVFGALAKLGGVRAAWIVGWTATAGAVIPLVPTPIATADRKHLPAFIAQGLWSQCVNPGGTMLTVPVASDANRETMRWVTEAGVAFSVPGTNAFVPGKDGIARYGPAATKTGALLERIDKTGTATPITPAVRAQAAKDLTHWQVQCVAVLPSTGHAQQDRAALTSLLGRGQLIGGVWTWKIG